jgi:hypothetical protein
LEERPPTPPDTYSYPPAQPPPPPPPSPPPPPPGGPPGPTSFPWERQGLDFFSALFETLKLLVTSPRRAFGLMPVEGGMGRALFFAIPMAWLGILATTLWEVALRGTMESLGPPWMGDRYEISSAMQIGVAALAPIWLPILLVIQSAIQHLFLMMVGGARSGYSATFKVACYVQVSALAGLVPVCGSLASLLWQVILLVIGFSAVHRISTGRAALAVLLPLFLCCGCLALALALGGAAWLAGMRGE